MVVEISAPQHSVKKLCLKQLHMAGVISGWPRDNVFATNKQTGQIVSPTLQTLGSQCRANNGGFVGIHMKIRPALLRSLRQQHILSFQKQENPLLSTPLITDQRTTWLLGKTPESNVIERRPLFGHRLTFIMKNISKNQNFSLHLRSNLCHETVLTLTHISTTLTVHWGNWQLDWAQGLRSFASGKEFGSLTQPSNSYTLYLKERVS